MQELLTREFFLDHFTTFEEKIDKRFDGIDQRLDNMDKRFDDVDVRFDTIEANHQELMFAVAGVITQVNDHMDERLTRLERSFGVRQRVQNIEAFLADKFGRDSVSPFGL